MLEHCLACLNLSRLIGNQGLENIRLVVMAMVEAQLSVLTSKFSESSVYEY